MSMKVTQNEILRAAREILLDCEEVAPMDFENRPRITFRVSSRMTRAAGSAIPRTGVVTLSLPFFEDRTNFDAEFRNTVTHEIAHVLSPPTRDPYTGRKSSHGPAWKAMHRRLGGTGDRCHTLDLAAGYERRGRSKRTEVPCSCGCGQAMRLGPTQLRRYQSGAIYLLRGHYW